MYKNKEEVEQCTVLLENAIDFDFYKTLFDPVRIKIISLLSESGSCSISEVAKHFPQDRTVISRYLSLMERYGIVSRVKKSREFIYHLRAEI